MKIVWTLQARQDRADIWSYLHARDEQAAARIDSLFQAAVTRLIDYPRLGHEGKIPGTRELKPHPSYRLVYEVDGETVWILTLVHAMRMWPPMC